VGLDQRHPRLDEVGERVDGVDEIEAGVGVGAKAVARGDSERDVRETGAATTRRFDHDRHLARWRLRLLDVEHAARDILHELRASGRSHVQVGETAPVHEAITYLANHHGKMNYAALRAAGLPIGSGNTEATCKTLVDVRMKRAGSRWNIKTARHVVHLRALATSDRWSDAMALTLRKSVRVAAVAA